MKDINKIVKSTKRTINLTALAFVVISLFSLYFNLKNDTISSWSFVSFVIGLFIIYSLLKAKSWAKILMTIISVLVIIISLVPTFFLLSKGSFYLALPNLALTIWFVYLVSFLNHGDTYDKYVQVVKGGYDFTKDSMDEIENIIDENRLIDFNRKEFNSMDDYEHMAKRLMKSDKMDVSIESINLVNNELIISTEDTDYLIEIDSRIAFFDNDFIKNLNSFLLQLKSELSVALVFPDTVANRSKTKIVLLSSDEISTLSKNGMINKT